MKRSIPRTSQTNLKVFIACLLSFLLLMAPLASVSAAVKMGASLPSVTTHENLQADKVQANTRVSGPAAPTASGSFLNLLAPAPMPAAGPLTATKQDALTTDADNDGKADPGVDVITYTVNITNTGTSDATGVNFSDNIDPNTTLVGGSLNASPLAVNDTYTTIGNTLLEVGVTASGSPAVTATGSVLDNDHDFLGDTFTLKTPFPTSSANGGTVTMNSSGNFSYLPPVGFTGTDTFTYTITDDGADNVAGNADDLTGTGTVTITVNAPKVWYVDSSYAGANGASDGRSTRPFTSLTPVNNTASDADAAGDIIYLFTGSGNYTTGITLENNEQLIGNGVALVVNTITLRGAGSRPTITNGAGNIITLASGNTVRGLNTGDTSGVDITGTSFGTFTADNMTLGGTGRLLNLTTGNLAVTFDSMTSTSSSGGAGISIAGATGSLTSTSGTSVTNPSAQCILIGTTTANISFGNTSCSGGTDGASFQNNSAGTRTFGTLSVSGGTGNAFLSAAGGGNVTVTGAANLSSALDPISIQNMTNGTAVSFAGTTVSKTTTGGAGITWGGTNTGATLGFASLGLTTSNGPGLVASGGGTINVTTGTISAMGSAGQAAPAISANGITLGATFTSVSSTNSSNSGNGISLTNVLGTLTMSGGSISGAAGDAFLVSGGTANITYNGTISTSAARPVNVASKTGGTLAFGGAVSSTSNGVLLNSNTGATINFTGGLSLSTGANDAFTATGGGTVSATQNNTTIVNTLTNTTGTALKVTSTTIGASGLTFRSITSNGSSANNGITLDTAGTGGLTVTGNGGTCTTAATCTGGTISNKTGGDGTGNGIGIYVNNTSNVSLTLMKLNDFSNYAVRGTTVTGFTMSNCFIDGTNGDNGGADEGTIIFDGLFGTSSFSGDTIKGGIEDNFRIINSNGTSNVTIDSCTIRDSNTTSGNDNVNIRSHGNANITAHVTNNTFAATNGDHIQTIADEQSTLTIVATGNTLSGGAPNSLLQGITISGGNATPSDSTETVRFNISNNNMTGTIQGGAININEGSGNGNWQGQVVNNTIGNAGVSCSGASQSSGIRLENHSKGSLTGIVSSNTIRQTCGAGGGISLTAGDNTASGLGNGPLNATVFSNTVQSPGGNFDHGIVLVGGAGVSGNTNQICLDLKNNTSEGSHVVGSSGFAYRIRQRFSQTVFLPGYGGAATDTAAVRTYILNRPNTAINGDGGDVSVTVQSPPGGGFQNGGAQCTQPIVPTSADMLLPDQADATAPQQFIATPQSVEAFAAHSNNVSKSVVQESTEPVASDSTTSLWTKTLKTQPLAEASAQPSASRAAVNNKQSKLSAHASLPRPLTPSPAPSGENVSVSIGTLPGGTPTGKTITIKFAVTVNDPFNGAQQSVSNQGSVTSSNAGSVMTDDPDTGTAGDPTITPVDAIQITIGDVSIAEGAVGFRQANFKVSLSNPAGPSGVSVHYSTANNTAIAPGDYTAIPDTILTIPSGATFGTITVQVKGDTIFEGNETFFVNLSSPVGGTLLDNQAIGTIADDEPQGADFDGDGLADPSLWSADNYWRSMNSSGSPFTPLNWGDSTAPTNDIAVPGDYDGDNKTDVAVFRPGEGNWYIIQSTTNTPVVLPWGTSNDRPVPADYDGDGKTDLAVFRPSEGNWYIKQSSNNATVVRNWGTPTDKLVAADYDGDGKADIAVWRPSEGNWYIIQSGGGGILIKQWGTGADLPEPGDYDGDGKADLVVWRPSEGSWHIRNSADNSAVVRSWGAGSFGDLPIPADYDGDGRTDIAVYRPSEGNWYIIKSSDNTAQVVSMGAAAGDRPVPTFYTGH